MPRTRSSRSAARLLPERDQLEGESMQTISGLICSSTMPCRSLDTLVTGAFEEPSVEVESDDIEALTLLGDVDTDGDPPWR